MEITRTTDDEQTTRWHGFAGHAWVALQEVLDQMFKPFEDLLVDAVFAGSGHRVLDVAYGTGSTTFAVAPARFDMIMSRFDAMFFKRS